MNTIDPIFRRKAAAAGAVGGTGIGEVEETPFLRYMTRLLFRWKKVIGGIVGACLLIGLVVTLLMTPQYTATTTIEIARESDRVTNIQGVQQEAGAGDQEFYQTQYGLLKSRSLAERVAAELKLADNPAFFQMFDVKMDGPVFGLDPNGRLPAGTRAARLRAAGGILADKVNISPMRSSRLVEISFISPDPGMSQRIANAWSANFITATLQRRFDANSYARRFLETRLVQLRQRLEQSERQLVGYASAQKIINLQNANGGERPLLSDDLTILNNDLAQSTADRVKAEARFKEARSRADQSTEALANPAINQLRTRRAEYAADYQKMMTQFKPDYPPAMAIQSQIKAVDAAIARERGRVGGALETAYLEAAGRENAMKARVEETKSSLLDMRRRSIQYQIFQREVDTNRQLYDALLQRYKEIGVAGGIGANNVAVVDDADLPERPSSPRLLLNMLLALVAGCALGGLAAFLLEQGDEAITDPTEVERMVGLPLLGTVPKLSRGTPVEALGDRKSELVDAYLAVQTNLAFSTEHGVPASVAITSTRPAEGKSTSSLSLATSLARAQKRVVLVDGDMRSPSIHHLIGTDHSRGLSNYLAGDDEIAALIHPVEQFGFAAITAGPVPPNAAELLTSDRLSTLIDALLKQFDHVVIDSPPVMGLADAPLIASRVEGVIYAVESHGIRSSMVRTALGRLASANARVVGIVLTKFEAQRGSAGYGYEYGYSYGRKAAGAE